MALIVENGTGLPNADAFVSLAEADAYFLNYNSTGWTGTNAQKEQAIRRATLWLSTYIKWNGSRTHGRDQALAWPRSGVTDCESGSIPDNVVPIEVKMAAYIASAYELSNPGGLTPAITPGQQTLSEKVDVIQVTYMTPAQQGIVGPVDPLVALRPVLTQITDLLGCIAYVGKAVPWPFVV